MPSPSDPTDTLRSTDVGLAVERLRSGGLVALPTETVYGLAALADDPDAVRRIFETKGRPADHPLIVHLPDVTALDDWVHEPPPTLRLLADTCWPGPLTVLLRRGPRASDVVTGGRDTVGIRVPSHPMAHAVLVEVGAVAAPSANRFGKVSPTTADHVLDDLGDRLDPDRDLVLDGGPCEVGVESTIVDLTVDPPQVLRAGAISADDIARLLAGPVAAAGGPSRTSGMLASHYAPDCDVVLAEDAVEAEATAAVRRASGQQVTVLDRTDDLVVAAQRLYDDLRAADRTGLDAVIVVLPPAAGIGHAIRDRLVKAAAARPDRSSPTG